MVQKLILSLILVSFSQLSWAQDGNIFTDPDFGATEFESVSKDLSAAFVHTTNSGGSSLGSIWGIEAGIVAGALEANNLKSIAEDISGEDQNELAYLPYAGLIGGVAFPFGIGAEVSMVPEVEFEDGSFSNFSASLRWSITDIIPLVGSFSPLKITAHASYGSTEMDYTFSLTGNSTETADFKIENTEIGVTAGFNLFVLEPYLGLSTVRTSSELNASTDSPLITPPDNQRNFDSSFDGTRVKAGVLFKFPLIRFGLEASSLNSSTRYTLKLSFKI